MTEVELDNMLRGQNKQKPLRGVVDKYVLPTVGAGVGVAASVAQALSKAQRRQTTIQV